MRKVLVLSIFLFMAGCASVSVQKYYKDEIYPATNPASITVFANKPAEKPFVEIGEITVTGAEDWIQVESIFRKKAAEMGADAVYVFSKEEESKQYVSPEGCYPHEGYYYPYNHFGWNRYHPRYHYPRGYFYCYGYRSAIETATFISAVGIVMKYTNPAS